MNARILFLFPVFVAGLLGQVDQPQPIQISKSSNASVILKNLTRNRIVGYALALEHVDATGRVTLKVTDSRLAGLSPSAPKKGHEPGEVWSHKFRGTTPPPEPRWSSSSLLMDRHGEAISRRTYRSLVVYGKAGPLHTRS